MFSRRLLRLAVVVAFAVAGTAAAGPAAAWVTYDPETQTGFVDQADVRATFGWTEATLAARAAGTVFRHDFWTDDTYSVSCGGGAFPMVHHRVFGNYELTAVVARAVGRTSSTGYGGRVTGFRLTGPSSGISGTSVGPMAGDPCPGDQGRPPGSKITRADLVSSSTGWALAAVSGAVRREFQSGRAPV